ncbi:sensor histidine kinase [Paenibacillus sp. M1]|uniref:Sensor histidine kinase n=1 Tax=Paenibacillus haidiansis TaxID=1574488 RepID=A0ABU7VY96_9BACL
MAAFALLIATLMSYVSYELIAYFQRKTTIQATEFNLQLVSHIIEQDLLNLSVLAMTCSTNSSTNSLLTEYFTSPEASSMDAVKVFASMQEDFRVNRSNGYVRRLIVTDHKDKFFQVDNLVSASVPLNIHNIHTLPGLTEDATEEWEQVIKDPLSNSGTIPYVLPIYGERSARIGTVYLLANVSVITDKLKGYSLPADSQLLLTLGERHYYIEDGKILPSSAKYRFSGYNKDGSGSSLTDVSLLDADGQEQRVAVSYQIRPGVALSQTLSDKEFLPQWNIWLLLVLGVAVLVIVLSGIITYYLTRTISLPVEKLKKRIDKIAQGNFLIDRNIEWNSELGDVGRGINRLSQDIVTLMETRLADEKQKQDLEYRMLQSQINPHFLYNTLNSIKWMATIQNATGIAEMTTSLSRLLRSIAKDPRKLVALRDEISMLDDYFLIQKYRYGNNIAMELRVEDEDLLSCLIPRFTLQPLVENAIFHGIEPKGKGHIIVAIGRSGGGGVGDGGVYVTVEDDGIGLSREQVAEILSSQEAGDKGLFEKVGLRSVNERLRLTFGDKYGLSIESLEGVYTKMKILIPHRKSEFSSYNH